jgi:dTDP-4-amino-4,6-dideoxygalactose transaminase
VVAGVTEAIPLFKVFMAEGAADAVGKVLNSGYVAQGQIVADFEEKLAERFDVPEVVTLNSGTSALHLSLHMIGVGPGDEVITTAQTCVATNGGIVLRGATPVWVDVDPRSGLIDPEAVAKAITPKTKAIIAVDWAGHPCDYDALKSHGIPVIQDAAHAVGTQYKGAHIAKTGGDYVCFSFQAIKHLTTGDGGALVVPLGQSERARRLRWFGLDRNSSARFRFEQDIPEAGFKYHMNDIAAAIGQCNLRHLDDNLFDHRDNATALHAMLSGISNVQLPPYVEMSSWWLFTIQVENPYAFADAMSERKIMCSPAHSRNDVMSAFKQAKVPAPMPGLDSFSKHQISIPVGWWLKAPDLAHIAQAVEECTKGS